DALRHRRQTRAGGGRDRVPRRGLVKIGQSCENRAVTAASSWVARAARATPAVRPFTSRVLRSSKISLSQERIAVCLSGPRSRCARKRRRGQARGGRESLTHVAQRKGYRRVESDAELARFRTVTEHRTRRRAAPRRAGTPPACRRTRVPRHPLGRPRRG